MSNISTFSLEYGELITFEYCSEKIYCETYRDGTVHTIYYFSGKISNEKKYLLADYRPLANISAWKTL